MSRGLSFYSGVLPQGGGSPVVRRRMRPLMAHQVSQALPDPTGRSATEVAGAHMLHVTPDTFC